MRLTRRRASAVVVVALGTATVAVAAVGSPPALTQLTNVPNANAKAPGVSPATVLSPGLAQHAVAWGRLPVENPGALKSFYGYDNNGPFTPAPGSNVEATKTEPDKNTYLVVPGLRGADARYDYGSHFLYQGHENGKGGQGAITRVNLDADEAHRVTLLAETDVNGKPLPTIDGSTWDPWAQRLLFTAELGSSGGVWQATPDFPARVENVSAWLGRGGFEGIQNDFAGNLYYLEDSGGASGTGANAKAKRPNSFVYRFLPHDPADLAKGGKIQALQVWTQGHPITWGVGKTPDEVINAPDFVALHQYGSSFPTKWLTIAETSAASAAPGPDDNALARAAGATPFKRPENGQFRPGSHFTELFFDETGDTNADSPANGVSGGWGSILRLVQSPASDDGTLSVFYNGDTAHTGFDNVAFLDRDVIAFVEDAGDGLHTQRNALDSGFVFDVTLDYSQASNQPVRFLAEGRDPSATIDSGLSGTPGFQNDGDNELTGIHVSDGDPGKHGILGDRIPKPFQPDGHWRVFYTQQHGENVTYEVTRPASPH